MKTATAFRYLLIVFIVQFNFQNIPAQTTTKRVLSGTIQTAGNEIIRGARVTVKTSAGEMTTVSNDEGEYRLLIPPESAVIIITGKNLVETERKIAAGDPSENLRIEVEYIIPVMHESLIISASQLDPAIDRRNDSIYRDTLFSRDDQVFQTLDAGISAGQHEGGGKSLEIRRFGFNLDHGGVAGGLKVMVDNVQQNQATQGHGQGYLGQLKSLTPELVQDVDILNGPFNAEYGDFSGLGVVQIRLKESLPDRLTLRLQGGSYGSFRTFLAYSPKFESGDALIAYEGSRTNGPFLSPLDYERDNLTGSLIHRLDESQKVGFKFNLGRNDFRSSGQIPLDEVEAGRLERFGFIDPDNGGRVRTGLFSAYYLKESADGGRLKLDGFISRSLFDLYSNFTFFLNDQVNGDEIRQHDSRLQEGVNAQYLRPFEFAGRRALLIAGANYHDNQINVGLDHAVARTPISTASKAGARVSNLAGYFQQGVDFFHGRLHLDAGLRYDYFRFRVDDRIETLNSGLQTASHFQPKFNLSLKPTERAPLNIFFNYGRGISSQDARGVVQQPESPKISTTDFYQIGTSHQFNRFSLSTDLFLIDRSNEQVYIPDDGSIEFRGPTRSSGFEIKSSIRITRYLAFNGGLTKVMNAFYRGTDPRIYIDSAPIMTSNAALTLTGWRGFSGSLRFRHIGNYRLDGEDPAIRASGFDVLDLSLLKRLHRLIDFNLSIDNLTDKRYYETQNYFESRIHSGDPVISRIHATPGYPITLTLGITIRLGGKD